MDLEIWESLYRDDLELITSLPLKHCGRVKFSHLGHLFAAVDAVFSVHLYSTHDRSHLAELKVSTPSIFSLNSHTDAALLPQACSMCFLPS